MKPILLATLEYPPQIGGIAEYLRRVGEQFPPGALEILAPAHGDAHASDMASDTAIFRRMLEWKFKPRWLPALFWTWALARRRRASFILVSHLIPMGTAARLAGRILGIPYGVVVHGTDIATALADGGLKRREAARVLKEAAFVVSNGAYVNQLLSGFNLPPSKILTIRPCPSFPLETVVAQVEADRLRVRLGVAKSFVVLSVGRLVKRKDFAAVIRAVAGLRGRGQDVRHVVVGEGPERAELEKLAGELRIADFVKFAGAVPKSDLPKYYAAADAFVMVPRSGPDGVEGFGIVYLEANLFEKPVIGSRTGGIPDAIVDGKTGLLVDAGDVAGLESAIRRFIDHPEESLRMGRRGRERVLESFRWRRQAAPLVAALAPFLGCRF